MTKKDVLLFFITFLLFLLANIYSFSGKLQVCFSFYGMNNNNHTDKIDPFPPKMDVFISFLLVIFNIIQMCTMLSLT